MKRVLIFSAILSVTLPCYGQVYKSIDQQGNVTYSDTPQGNVVNELPEIDEPYNVQRLQQIKREAIEANERARERTKTIEQAWVDIREAEHQLKIADEQLVKGQEPLPGERIGNAGGLTRLSDRYWQRLALLQQAVEIAEINVQKAYQRLSLIRGQ